MNLRKLASAIAKIEGKKHQATVGDIREIISIMVKMNAAHMLTSSSQYGAVDTLLHQESRKLLMSKQTPAKKQKRKKKK